jgi:DNA-binding NarL/FixJ family response regulator
MKDTDQVEQRWLPNVLGYLAVKDLATLEERVEVLARLGYANKDIAKICGTTPLSVSVRKANLNKRGSRKSSRGRK